KTDTYYQKNSMIDYYSQLIVHLDIKRWFVTTNQYSQYQKILDRKVGEYVYFVLFHTNESGKSIKGYFSKIGKSDEILECIHPEQFNGFIRWLLKAVAKKSYNTALVLLNGRKMIRGIYRRGRKNGRNIPL